MQLQEKGCLITNNLGRPVENPFWERLAFDRYFSYPKQNNRLATFRAMRDALAVSRWYYIVLGAILLGGVVYMYVHRGELGLTSRGGSSDSPASTASNAGSATGLLTGPSAATDQNGTALKPPHIVWAPANRDKEGFEVELPTDAQEIQIPVYNETGGTEQVNMLYAYPDSNTSFSITWADEPPVERASGNSADKTLDMARDNALARTQATLVSESRDNRLGFPARDFVGRNEGGGLLNARLILAGRRLYMLIAAFPAASARRDEDVNHFFDSFRITAKN